MGFRILSLAVATAALLSAQPPGGLIHGQVVDSAYASIGKAFVRIRQDETTSPVLRARSEFDGKFTIKEIPPGTYTVRAWVPGFHPGIVRNVQVRAGETTDIGVIVLSFSGCDAPGVICDDFTLNGGDQPGASVVVIDRTCGLDLDEGNKSCSQYDIALTIAEDKSIYLSPANGAKISASCNESKFERAPLRIDGLGPGDEICVLTKRGHTSHLFLMDEVPADAAELRLSFVTTR